MKCADRGGNGRGGRAGAPVRSGAWPRAPRKRSAAPRHSACRCGGPRYLPEASAQQRDAMDAPGQQQLSPAEEQEKWLQDAFKAVKQAAFYMRRALVRARLLLRTALATPVAPLRAAAVRPGVRSQRRQPHCGSARDIAVRRLQAAVSSRSLAARRMRTTCARR